MSIVHILKNQSMPNIIKVGIKENLERRIKSLTFWMIHFKFSRIYFS
ncbi:hypothetical protein OAJ75_02540 [Candidatus Pelagibacter sp.]|nr:hypothetical protein [Candidatus Pelagibacter sp.]